ncbi:hypothetical protein J7T55_015490 [Diaporthe amygdali]|uniref:uncharacterized protein n=1 Tax=Phomopsis amygdali TaxID=1214568 RepID=UPI0022FDEAF0|nr:uncharacterized protein J7T55_015490 [Diaporthe amygdali]KAJ0120757.1 hypothetical protein J7T55_015490 [Diaporthe amygdali]
MKIAVPDQYQNLALEPSLPQFSTLRYPRTSSSMRMWIAESARKKTFKGRRGYRCCVACHAWKEGHGFVRSLAKRGSLRFSLRMFRTCNRCSRIRKHLEEQEHIDHFEIEAKSLGHHNTLLAVFENVEGLRCNTITSGNKTLNNSLPKLWGAREKQRQVEKQLLLLLARHVLSPDKIVVRRAPTKSHRAQRALALMAALDVAQGVTSAIAPEAGFPAG